MGPGRGTVVAQVGCGVEHGRARPPEARQQVVDSRSGQIPGGGEPLRPRRPLWRELLSGAGALFLGGVFLYAAYAKAIDPVAFAEHVAAEELGGWLGDMETALVAIGLEVFLGVALVLLVRRWWILLPTTALVGFFLFLTGRNWYRDANGIEREVHNCGCFGNLVDRTPQEAFLQDLALMVPALLLAWLAGRGRGALPWGRTLLALVLGGASVFFSTQAPEIEALDDLATRIEVGDSIDQVCRGSDGDRVCLGKLKAQKPLTQGPHLLILGDITNPDWTEEYVPKLHAAMEAWRDADEFDPELRVWLVTPGTEREVRDFRFDEEPEFDLISGPQSLLRTLYRRLPRSIVIENGVVIRTADGLIPPARWRP